MEEKYPQYFPFEMQTSGDQNIKYGIYINSLITEVRLTNLTFGDRPPGELDI